MLARPGVLLTLLLAPAAGRADEAVRHDGTRLAGRLSLSATGRFAFRAEDRDQPVSGLDLVRFQPTPPPDPAGPLWHQVRMSGGQVLLAHLFKLDAAHLHVRTAWADSLAIPRTAIEGVTDAFGWRPVLVETFDCGRAAWAAAGDPRAADGQLVLDRAGQSVEAGLKTPLTKGRVRLGFRGRRTAGRRAWLELRFIRDRKPSPVRVELAGPGEHLTVESPSRPQHAGHLKRDAQPNRLTVEFDRDRLAVYLGELVLWAQADGPGELQAVRLAMTGDGAEAVEIDDVIVSRAEPARVARPWADLTADAIRSPDGDETFGDLAAAGPAGLTLEVAALKRGVGWPEAADFTFRRGPVTERSTTGEHVQLRVRSVEGLRDVLEGAVKSLDQSALVLSHAVLGDLTVPRARLEEIRFRFHGQRVPVDATPRHLGTRPAFGFAVPRPGGLRFTQTVKVPAAAGGFVVVDAAQVSGSGTPVEVRVAGEAVGELNRQADRPNPVVRSYRVPLPALRAGDVDVEVRVRPAPDGVRVSGVDLRAVRLELSEPR